MKTVFIPQLSGRDRLGLALATSVLGVFPSKRPVPLIRRHDLREIQVAFKGDTSLLCFKSGVGYESLWSGLDSVRRHWRQARERRFRRMDGRGSSPLLRVQSVRHQSACLHHVLADADDH